MSLVVHEHELDLVSRTPETGLTRALARRLVDGALRPQERDDLARVTQIATLEEEGQNYVQIAPQLGWSVEKLRQWVQSDKYRLLRRYVAERALITDDVQAQDRRKKDRQRFDSNTGRALDYFDQAFRRHETTKLDQKTRAVLVRAGDFRDLDRAERATKLIAAAQGWLEPIPTSTKPKDLSPGVIQAQMQAIRAADNKEMVVRVTTASGETIEVGVRNQQAEDIA